MRKEIKKSYNSPLNFLSYLIEEGTNQSPFLFSKRKDSGLSYEKAFTLVELIVVVTILAILSTIGFVSYSGYLAGVRDTNRVSQLKSIADGLEMYRTKHDLPIPEDYIEVEASGTVVAYQGYVGKNVLETIEYSSEGVDPKDGSYYSYYLTKNKKYFQLMAFLEEEDNLQVNVQSGQTRRSAPTTKSVGVSFCVHPNGCNTAQAIDYTSRYPTVYGKKLGILTDKNNTPIQEVEEVVNSGYLDIVNTDQEYKAILDNKENIFGTGSKLFILENLNKAGGSILRNCKLLLEKRNNLKGEDGLYLVSLSGLEKNLVYCDMTTNGGGWTRFVNIKGDYSTDDARNCWLGNIISNDNLECFNPNRFGIGITKLLNKDWSGVYEVSLLDNTSSVNTETTVSNRYCLGQSEYMTIMKSDSTPAEDGSDFTHIRLGRSYCKHSRDVGGKSINNSTYMNYDKQGEFGEDSGAGREDHVRNTELYFK